MLIAQAADCMVMMLISSFRNALLLVYSCVFCVTLLRGVIIRQWGVAKLGAHKILSRGCLGFQEFTVIVPLLHILSNSHYVLFTTGLPLLFS